MPLGKEQIEQIKVAEFLRQCTDLPFMHIANERNTNAHEGAILKRMGVLSGVSDLFLPRKNKIYSGLWLELKTTSGKPSQAQKDFLLKMVDEGYDGTFAYGANEAIAIIRDFYGI